MFRDSTIVRTNRALRVLVAAWTYAKPKTGYEALAGLIAFCPAPMDRCLVGGEPGRPQHRLVRVHLASAVLVPVARQRHAQLHHDEHEYEDDSEVIAPK